MRQDLEAGRLTTGYCVFLLDWKAILLDDALGVTVLR